MKKLLAIVSIILCTSMLLIGCKKTLKPTNSGSGDITKDVEKSTDDVTSDTSEVTSEDAMTEASDDNSDASAALSSGEFTKIADICDYWNDLYTSNEAVLNAYEGMPIMELVTPGLGFVTGVQYDILNINNKDGRFEGELMLAGFPAFVEKKGSQLTFGYEDIAEEDGFTTKKGDLQAESGNCDLDKGYYYSDSYTKRESNRINRTTNEFQKQADGSMCVLITNGSSLNYQNEEELTTTYIFIRNGKDQYDFVLANAAVGTEYEILHLKDNMTKEMAMELLKSAGAAIGKSGGIKDKTLVVD